MGHRSPSHAGAYGFGLLIGIPGFLVAGKAFCWIVPVIAAGMKAAL